MTYFLIKLLLAFPFLKKVIFPMVGLSDKRLHTFSKDGEIKIACVGDSITYGALLPNRKNNAYPSVLRKLLGEKYHVENFGLNGRCLQSSSTRPYTNEEEYRKSIEYGAQTVVILIGTNDTKPANWVSKEYFKIEFEKILKVYLGLETTKSIIICTPLWQGRPNDKVERFTNDTLEEHIPDIVSALSLTGEKYNIPVIDFHSMFFKRTDLLCYDKVHPNILGAKLIAQKVYEEIVKTSEV